MVLSDYSRATFFSRRIFVDVQVVVYSCSEMFALASEDGVEELSMFALRGSNDGVGGGEGGENDDTFVVSSTA